MKLYNQELINDQGMTKEANVFICLVNILNNNKKDTMRNSASKLNTLKAARVFKD